MTDIKRLILLNNYCIAQRNVLMRMLDAMEAFENEEMVWMWKAMFDWCEAKDRREELWKQFKRHYPRAMMLKEGIEV